MGHWRLPLFREQIRICFCQKRKSANNESAKCQCAALCQSSTIQQSLTTSIGTLTILHILIYANISFFWQCFSSFLLDACCNALRRREADVVLTPDADPWISREVRRRATWPRHFASFCTSKFDHSKPKDDTRGWWEREDGWQASWENTCLKALK